MAGFMEVSFPFSQTQNMFGDVPHHPSVANGASSHWNFLPVQSNGSFHHSPQQMLSNGSQQCGNRKRSYDQAQHTTSEQAKRARPDMPYANGLPSSSADTSASGFFPSMDLSGSVVCQQPSFPSSYFEHQAVALAEKKYHSSLLEALLYEVHGC